MVELLKTHVSFLFLTNLLKLNITLQFTTLHAFELMPLGVKNRIIFGNNKLKQQIILYSY